MAKRLTESGEAWIMDIGDQLGMIAEDIARTANDLDQDGDVNHFLSRIIMYLAAAIDEIETGV